ncbi:hypothetical protein M378DRAFT_161790 [Amanita muscaria Koide BX008]|uniref:Uncharacterized protein n=1 Tax=Amanita muscaria (strain Koide BX008) TaxID=946122 RepID=A0A0C2XAD5_AMAMK|nr:hypothetical protein M378DRAFT_161790 [Amanita muscaria Koide BX008]
MGHHCPVCKKTAKSGCVGKHFWYCKIHTDKTYIAGHECASCKNAREAEARRAQQAAAAAAKAKKKK